MTGAERIAKYRAKHPVTKPVTERVTKSTGVDDADRKEIRKLLDKLHIEGSKNQVTMSVMTVAVLATQLDRKLAELGLVPKSTYLARTEAKVEKRLRNQGYDEDGAAEELATLKPQLARLAAEIGGDLTKAKEAKKFLGLLKKARPLVLNYAANRSKAWDDFLSDIGTKGHFVLRLEKVT
jgi:hypothetical protein